MVSEAKGHAFFGCGVPEMFNMYMVRSNAAAAQGLLRIQKKAGNSF
jgi:hypothetical protein